MMEDDVSPLNIFDLSSPEAQLAAEKIMRGLDPKEYEILNCRVRMPTRYPFTAAETVIVTGESFEFIRATEQKAAALFTKAELPRKRQS